MSQERDQELLRALLTFGENAYLCHNFILPDPSIVSEIVGIHEFGRIQGPSLEIWKEFEDTSKSGTDHVPSIRCKFWPTSAAEWIDRPRDYGWPTKKQHREDYFLWISSCTCRLSIVSNEIH